MDTFEAIQHVSLLEGAYVECGVHTGHHPIICAKTILQKNLPLRDIYLFDTFEGLTEPGEFDYTTSITNIYKMSKDQVKNEWTSKQKNGYNDWCYCPLEQVKNNMKKTNYPEDRVKYVKGDVRETLLNAENIPDKISVLRLDTDWYDSSKIEMEVLYDKVVDGGVIIFDDYFHWDGQRRATDDFFQSRGLSITVNRVNNKTGYIIRSV